MAPLRNRKLTCWLRKRWMVICECGVCQKRRSTNRPRLSGFCNGQSTNTPALVGSPGPRTGGLYNTLMGKPIFILTEFSAIILTSHSQGNASLGCTHKKGVLGNRSNCRQRHWYHQLWPWSNHVHPEPRSRRPAIRPQPQWSPVPCSNCETHPVKHSSHASGHAG